MAIVDKMMHRFCCIAAIIVPAYLAYQVFIALMR